MTHGPHIEPCRLCADQGRSFEGTGLPIFKRFLNNGSIQACLLCDGTGWPEYTLILGVGEAGTP